MIEFITAMDIAKDLGVSRQRVHQIIKDQNIEHSKIGNLLLVDKISYSIYLKLRRRRDLATAAGRKEIKLIRSAEYDIFCPVCGSFAVNWKGTVACENGHIVDEWKDVDEPDLVSDAISKAFDFSKFEEGE